MVGGYNKLVTALIIVFAVTFVGLLAEIFYVLWQRRQYQQQSPASDDSVVVVQAKECVYLFCWRKQSRIEPNEITTRVDEESEVDEEEKWQELCGPSRVLFTIKEEEEREGMESLESECCSLVADEAKLKQATLDPECKPDPATRIQIDDDPTPFGTPCASPPYYTPSPSPAREADVGSSNLTTVPADDNLPVDKASDDNKTPFFALEIRGH